MLVQSINPTPLFGGTPFSFMHSAYSEPLPLSSSLFSSVTLLSFVAVKSSVDFENISISWNFPFQTFHQVYPNSGKRESFKNYTASILPSSYWYLRLLMTPRGRWSRFAIFGTSVSLNLKSCNTIQSK